MWGELHEDGVKPELNMSWLWMLSLRARANTFRRWYLTERQAAIWTAIILGNGPRTTAWPEEGHCSQWVTSKGEYRQLRSILLCWAYPGDSELLLSSADLVEQIKFWGCCLIHRAKGTWKKKRKEWAERINEFFSGLCMGYLWGCNLDVSCRLGF